MSERNVTPARICKVTFIISEPCTIDLKDCVTNKILCTLRLLSIFYPTRQRPDTTGFPSDLASPSRPEPASHLQGTETNRRHAPSESRVLHPLPLLYTQHQQPLARVVVFSLHTSLSALHAPIFPSRRPRGAWPNSPPLQVPAVVEWPHDSQRRIPPTFHLEPVRPGLH